MTICKCGHAMSEHIAGFGCGVGHDGELGITEFCPCLERRSDDVDMQAPAPISGEAGAVSAIADHSAGSGPPGITTPPVEADGAARPSYRQGLQTREHRLVRQLAEARLSWAEGKHDAAWFLAAAFAVADLVPILKCPGCDSLFIPQDARQTTYCSDRCRYRVGMRARRRRLAAAEPTSPVTEYRKAAK